MGGGGGAAGSERYFTLISPCLRMFSASPFLMTRTCAMISLLGSGGGGGGVVYWGLVGYAGGGGGVVVVVPYCQLKLDALNGN